MQGPGNRHDLFDALTELRIQLERTSMHGNESLAELDGQNNKKEVKPSYDHHLNKHEGKKMKNPPAQKPRYFAKSDTNPHQRRYKK